MLERPGSCVLAMSLGVTEVVESCEWVAAPGCYLMYRWICPNGELKRGVPLCRSDERGDVWGDIAALTQSPGNSEDLPSIIYPQSRHPWGP